jgi:tetratricopeptide (TPR) repeat protein
MRKRINLKALCAIIAVMGVLMPGVHFLHGYQVRRQAGILLARAGSAESQGRLEVAADYLSRYVSLVPDEADVRVRHALLVADNRVARTPKAVMRAFFTLSRAVQLAPERDDARRRLVTIAMHPSVERYGDAEAHLAKLPADAATVGARARCAEELGKYKEARLWYEQAIGLAPTEVGNYARLASLLRNGTRAGELRKAKDEDTDAVADATINALVDANPSVAGAHLIRARYLQKKMFDTPNDRDRLMGDVETNVEQARKLDPFAVEVILAVAGVAREKNAPDVARRQLQEGIERHPREWSLVQALAELEMLDGHADAALACLNDGLKENPGQLDLLWNYANLLIFQQQDNEAADVIARLQKAGVNRAELDYLQARMSFGRADWIGTARTLERVYPLFLSGYDRRKNWFSFNLAVECSLLLGNCYEQLGDPYRAASAYDRAAARDPRSVPGRRGLARMKWAIGQLDAAEHEYRHLVNQRDAPPAVWIELAQLLIARNRRSEHPDWQQVRQLLELAERQPAKSQPPPETLALLRAEVLAAQKEYDQAQRQLEAVHANKKTRPSAVWAGLADLEMQRGKTDAAMAILDEAVKQLGDRIELRSARARLWVGRPGEAAVQALLQLGQDLDRFGDADRLRFLRVLADAHQQIASHAEAARLWRVVAAECGSDLGSRLTLFDLAMQADDLAEMEKLTRAIQEIEGHDEGTLWRYCLACQKIRLAERGHEHDLAEAAHLLKIVADRRPGWACVPLALAQIDDLRGRPEAAVANYTRAVVLGEQRPAVIQHLVRVLTERGHHLAAEEMIRRLRVQSPMLLAGLERPAAEIALFRRDIAGAVILARKAVPADSRDHRDHIWLGRLLWAAGKPAEAESALRRAIALADQVPQTWVALVQHLVRTGDKKQAEAVVREAEEKLPRGKSLLDLAQCYDMIGRTNRARELYEAAFAANPQAADVLRDMALLCLKSDRPDEAKAHLNRIREIKTSSPKAVSWANRLLAILTASRGGPQNTQAALALLAGPGEELQRASTTAENVDNERARAAILATQPSVRKRRQAIEILEGLRRSRFITPDEQFMLAQLYDTVGDWRASRAYLVDLLSATESKLEGESSSAEKQAWQTVYGNALAFYAGRLLLHGDVTEGQLWHRKLERLEPDTVRTQELKARLLAKQGNSTLAVPVLKKLADGHKKLILQAATILEQIGETTAARGLFEQYTTDAPEPERLLTLAAFHGRQKRATEALELCDRAWKSCPPEAVASTSVGILHSAGASAPEYERVAQRLMEALSKHPDKAVLATSLAAVRRLQGRHREALELLQRVSARDPGDAIALNNIAWLLALQRKPDEALTAIKSAMLLRGEQANLLDTRAVAYIAKGMYAQAIADLDEAIAETPTAHRYFHLAQAHRGAHHRDAALEALRRGKNLGLSETSIDPLERSAYQELIQMDRR